MDRPERAILDVEFNQIGYGRYALLAHNRQLGSFKESMRLEAEDLMIPVRELKMGREDMNLVREVGTSLYDALTQSMREYWGQFLENARSSGRLPLLRLALSAPELDQLPWEMMFDHERRPLAQYVSVLRVLPERRLQMRPPVLASPYLHVLVAAAAPSDYPPQHIEAGVSAIRRAIVQAESSELRSNFVPNTTPALLRRHLSGEPVHILHFIGHVTAGDTLRKSSMPDGLVLESDSRDSDLLMMEQVGEILRSANLPLLILDTATAVPLGIPAYLTYNNAVNAVISFQFEIPDRNFLAPFWGELYSGIGRQIPVDEALFQARSRLMDWPGLGSSAWGGPVLTMAGEGQLFDYPGRSAGDMSRLAAVETPGGPPTSAQEAGGENLNNLIQQQESLEKLMAIYGGLDSAPENLKLRWQALQQQIDRLRRQS